MSNKFYVLRHLTNPTEASFAALERYDLDALAHAAHDEAGWDNQVLIRFLAENKLEDLPLVLAKREYIFWGGDTVPFVATSGREAQIAWLLENGEDYLV